MSQAEHRKKHSEIHSISEVFYFLRKARSQWTDLNLEILFLISLNILICLLQNVGIPGNYLVSQWLGYLTCITRGMGSIPGQEAKIPHATWYSQKSKSVEYRFPLMYKCCFSWKDNLSESFSFYRYFRKYYIFQKKKKFPYTDYMFYCLKSNKLKTVNT